MKPLIRLLPIWLIVVIWCLPQLSTGWAAPPEARGLTEPYRLIDVAALESGVITKLMVSEGDVVARGQALATLDSETLLALRAMAEQSKESRGRLQAAQAEVQLREDRVQSFAEVFAAGHARPEEVRRANTDLEIARGNLLAAQEDLALKELEYEKIRAQIDRRTVRAPIAGVVSHIHKDEGEFVAPNDPAVLTLVQLDPLFAVFSLPTDQFEKLHVGQEVLVQLTSGPQPVTAIVEFIAPITDAESGTVLVKVRVANPAGTYRSGTRCTLQIPTTSDLTTSEVAK